MKKSAPRRGPAKPVNNRVLYAEKVLQEKEPLQNEVAEPEITDAELAKREPSPDKKIYNIQDQYGNLKERVVEPRIVAEVTDVEVVSSPIPDEPMPKKVQFEELKPMEPLDEQVTFDWRGRPEIKINTIKEQDPQIKKEEIVQIEHTEEERQRLDSIKMGINRQFDQGLQAMEKLAQYEAAGCQNIAFVTPNAASRKEPNILMAQSDLVTYGLSSAIIGVGGFLLLKWIGNALFGSKPKAIKRRPQKKVVVVEEDSETEPESDY